MIEYELEHLNWKKRQLELRQKYTDTPPGLSAEQAETEYARLSLAWKEYEEQRRFCLTTGLIPPEEPFAGRQKELQAIRRFFETGKKAVFLSGMGGIGKSALARAYTRTYAGEYGHILVWSYDKSLEQIFADDGQLGISGLCYTQNRYHSQKQYAKEKYEKLFQIAESERLLIILDNYNRMEDPWLEALFAIPCDLLATTRLSPFLLEEKGYAPLLVESLSDESDWKEFYRIYTGKKAEGSAWETVKAYQKSVLGHTLKMKLALSNPAQTWSTEQLARSILSNFRLKKTEIRILCELSFMTLLGILEEAYLLCTEEKPESLDILKSYSLVQQRTDSMGRTFLFLHPVIAEAVRATWHPGVARCLKFLEKFSYYARFSWYRPREGDLWLVPQVSALLKKLPKPVPWRYSLYENLATFLLVWEYFREAEEIVRPLYECVRAYYGESHQFTAYLALRMGEIYYDSMQFEKGQSWYALSYRLYGEAQPVTHHFHVNKADVSSRLARVYEYAGDYEAGHRFLDTAMKAMEDFRKDTEEAAPDLWLQRRHKWQYAYMRRASLYFRQGDLKKAQQELDTGLRLFPMDEFQQVEVRRLQAHLYFARGEYQQAQEAAAKDLELCVRYQGETYKMSLACRELLGDALLAQGKAQAAQAEYIRVLEGLQKKYPYQAGWRKRMQRKLGNCS